MAIRTEDIVYSNRTLRHPFPLLPQPFKHPLPENAGSRKAGCRRCHPAIALPEQKIGDKEAFYRNRLIPLSSS